MVTRRRVLQFGLFGAGALALGSFTLASRATRLRAPKVPLQLLTPQEFSIVAAIADRVIPAHDLFIPPADAETAERVDALLAHAHPGLSGDVRQLLHLFENGLANFAFDQRPRPFTQMSPEDQDATLADWGRSRITLRKTGFKVLTGLVCAAYYSNPRTYPAVGYPGPPSYPRGQPGLAVAAADKLEDAP